MAKLEFKVAVKGVAKVRTMTTQLAIKMANRRDLHSRWAILALNWINRNFTSEGGMVGGWKPLRPGTLAGRRGGAGRVLQDTGLLRASFVPRWSSTEAVVGSPLKTALWHEKGTGIAAGKGYIQIRPRKPGGVLAFPVAIGTAVKTKRLASGKTISLKKAEAGTAFVRYVLKNPGVPKRRMLPRENEPTLMKDLLKAAINYVKETERRANG